jgi:hypothetical protein
MKVLFKQKLNENQSKNLIVLVGTQRGLKILVNKNDVIVGLEGEENVLNKFFIFINNEADLYLKNI